MPDRSPPTRIGFNAALTSLVQDFRAAGMHRYIVALLSALAEVDDVRIVAFVPGGHTPADFPAAIAVRRAPAASRRPAVRIVWEQTALPVALARMGADVHHGPAYAMPLACPCPAVVTVHDLSFIRMPDTHPRARRLYLSAATRLSVRRAKALIAVSAFTAREMTELLGVAPDRIHVVPNGVDARFRPASAEAQAGARRRLALPERYILTVATLEPRKNLTVLLKAQAVLCRQLTDPPSLVVAGAAGWGDIDPAATAARLGIAEHVRWLGYVGDDDLPALYTAAEVFAYPSRYEGFGLPALEAMACGAPVVVAGAASLPEVVGDGAEIVRDDTPGAWAATLGALVGDAARRHILTERGRARAAGFTWARTATATAAVYRHARSLGVPANRGRQAPHARA